MMFVPVGDSSKFLCHHKIIGDPSICEIIAFTTLEKYKIKKTLHIEHRNSKISVGEATMILFIAIYQQAIDCVKKRKNPKS